MNETVSTIGGGMRVVIQGAVQGVGFRPFIFRLANEMGLKGWVLNTAQGVVIEIDGDTESLELFLQRLQDERPPNSSILKLNVSACPVAGFESFEIRLSENAGEKIVQVMPDLATCWECQKEVLDPSNRRYQYPFTNCTHCGPRFSIIEGLPYDRANTTMRGFKMCEVCQREYEDPTDRRFHAQPTACPVCGPHLELWDKQGQVVCFREDALVQSAAAVTEGRIAAVKGLGGFHLVVDARNEGAVLELRKRKHREEKPFAVMFPNLEAVLSECEVSEEERKLLVSTASPIVLLKRRKRGPGALVCQAVAPGNPFLGVMMPYTPLHALLLREVGFPVVATSGNLSEEPICTDENEALGRLAGIADLFLVHNRPIARAMDDSVVKVVFNKPLMIRAGRGHAPLAVAVGEDLAPVLAVGGHMKNTVAVTAGKAIFISQHIGDLDSEPSCKAFLKAQESLKTLYGTEPNAVARDLHPDYFSSQYADRSGLPSVGVQHHHAHVVSCMAEHGLKDRVLGVSWDGSGYGTDGSVWGGEFLLATRAEFHRVGSFRPYPLPGGEIAVREPRRTALGLLFEMLGEKIFDDASLTPVRAFEETELRIVRSMLQRRVNAPTTSSVGRIFDAVASMVDLKQKISFEGQAAMALEFSVGSEEDAGVYPFFLDLRGDEFREVDWEPMIREILLDVARHTPTGRISSRFHNTLVEIIVGVAEASNQKRVVLSGGCFQNGILLERAVRRLREEGRDVYWPQRVPPNDGGLSLGQAVVAASRLRGETPCA